MAPLTVNGAPKVNGTLTNGDSHLTNGHAQHKKPALPPHFIGGNHLEAAPASSVKDFVASHEGHTVITNVSKDSANSPGRSSILTPLLRYLSQITVSPP